MSGAADGRDGRPVVAGVDGSDSARHAAWWAAAEANRRGVPLRLVYAVNVATYAGGFVPPVGLFEALEAEGRERLAEAEDEIRRGFPELDVRVALRSGHPTPLLIEESREAAMVVIGSRGLGWVSGLLAGSTAVAMAAHAHCPVAVIRGQRAGQPPAERGPVVVGVDGSPVGEPAIAVAFDQANARGAELVAVHAWGEFASEVEFRYAHQFISDWDPLERRARELLADRLASWQEKYPDVTVHRVVSGDQPTRALLGRAHEAQLLVVGSRGRGGFRGMLLGSTSQALVHRAECPVIVARSTVTEESSD